MMYLLIAGLIGCGDKETTADDTSTDTTTTDSFSDYIYVTEPPSGDFTGFESGYTDAWLAQEVDKTLRAEVPMTGQVEDFESGDAVDEATLELFYSNSASGTADQSLLSDGEGNVSGTWPVCQPVAYRTSTDPDRGDTKVTIQVNEIAGSSDAVDLQFNSVSYSTYQVIPSLLGVSPDIDKGIVAGTAYDINGDPITNAQVIIVDDSGVSPETLVVKYFVDDFPNRDQEWTSADGLFVAINVPVGDWDIQMYVADGAGGHQLMGVSKVSVLADSINISSVYTGSGDGVRYPDSCLVGAETGGGDDTGN